MGYPWLTEWGSRSPESPRPATDVSLSLYDTTLRDGEQQAGLCFDREQKVRMFRAIERTGINFIETGMIPVHEDEQKVVQQLAAEGHDSKVYVLARATDEDIELAQRCGADGVTIEMLANLPLATLRFGWTGEEIIGRMSRAVKLAKDLGLEANVFAIDATRADTEWLATFFGAAAGEADYVTLADTFGVCEPEAMRAMVGKVRAATSTPVQVHCHEDYGLGTANSLASVEAGAAVVQGTINGLGERAGNTSLPEFAASARFLKGWSTGADLGELRNVAHVVAEESGIPLRPNAPVVGPGLFDMESGIVTALYEALVGVDERHVWPYLPEKVGAAARIALGKGSGIANVRMRAKDFGWDGSSEEREEDLREVMALVKEAGAALRRCLTDDEAAEIFARVSSAGRNSDEEVGA